MNEYLMHSLRDSITFIIFLIENELVKDLEDAMNSEIYVGGVQGEFPDCNIQRITPTGMRYFNITVKGVVYPISYIEVVESDKNGQPVRVQKYELLNKEKATI